MTTTLAHGSMTPAGPPPSGGASATPTVTAVVVVGMSGASRTSASGGSPSLSAERLGEVLDAVADQVRPPDRLVLVVGSGPAGPHTPGSGHPVTSAFAAVSEVLEAHDRVRESVPSCTVLAVPHPRSGDRSVPVGVAVRVVLGAEGGDGRDLSPDGPAEARGGAAGLGGPGSPGGAEWLWLLDDASAPAPTALVRLVDAVRRSHSVGVAGPKVVDWDDPRRLVELGRQVTRAGRLIDSPEPGEADQGQYDTRTDVLAVGTTGMLVSRSVLESVGGFDRAFPVHGADLDLGWRAQLAGHRVVVVPTAVVRRADCLAPAAGGTQPDPGAAPRLASRRADRRASRRVALTRCTPLAVPFLALWILLSSVGGAAALLLLKRPQHAWSELSDLGSLLRPIGSLGARWRFRRGKVVRRRNLATLFVGAGTAAGHTWDRVQEAFTPDQTSSGLSQDQAGHPGHPAGSDSELATETGPVAEEAQALTGLPPSLPQRIATHPGVLAVVACVVLAALMFRGALTQGVLDAQGAGLAGGELHALATDSGGLWHQFRDGWHGAGLGNALDVSPGVGVLAALTWVVERLPYVEDGRSSASVTLAWLMLAAMPLSAMTAYVAGRVATRARWGRGLVALAWGSSGVLVAAISSGRVPVVVAHILLPLVVAGFAAALKRHGTWTVTFATALVTGVLGAFVPALLALSVAAALVAVLVGPGLGRRLRALVLLVVPTALLGPWVLRFVDEPRLLLTGAGLIDVGTDSPPPWQLALAQPDGGRRLVGLLFVPLLVVAVLALVRRSGGRARTCALLALSAAALVGLAVALGSERVEVGQAPGDDGVSALATLWTGVGLEVYVAAVLAIVLTGWHGLAHALGERRWGWRRVFAGISAGVVVLSLAAAGGVLAWAGSGSLSHAADALPAVAVDQARGPDGNRLVVLTPQDDRLDFTLYGNEPGELMRDVTRSTDVTDPGIATVLGSLSSGASAVPGGAGAALADLGIGFVSVRAAADSSLSRTLDASPGLTRLGSTDDQTLWRVLSRSSSVAADVPVAPSRVRLDDASGNPLQSVPVIGPHGAVSSDLSVGAAGRTVVFAEAPQWAEHAVVTYDGVPLTVTSATGPPTYAIPAAAGRLEADLPPAHQRWFLAQLALLAVVVFLAVPFGSRRSRRLT